MKKTRNSLQALPGSKQLYGFKFVIQPFNLLTDDVQELGEVLVNAGCVGGLLVLDTLMRATIGTDENSSKDMGRIIAAAEQLQKLIGGLVMVVHHTGKDSTKGLRGHSSLYGALDGAIEVIKTEFRREWSVAKSKDDVTGASHQFKLEIIPVGLDSNGQEITSCVVLADNAFPDFKVKKPSLGSNQKIALQEIEKLLTNSSFTGLEGVPATYKCIKYDEAVLRVAELMPTE